MDDAAVYSQELAAHEEKESHSAIIKFQAQNKSGAPLARHPEKVNQNCQVAQILMPVCPINQESTFDSICMNLSATHNWTYQQ